MGNPKKMIQANQDRSREKVDLAISTIKDMLNKDEQVVVRELQKRTGLSRTFFYYNEEVRAELTRAQQLQEGKSFAIQQKVILDKAMNREIELLRKTLKDKEREIEELKGELLRLKKLANANTLRTLKSL